MEDVVGARHGDAAAFKAAHVSDVELYLVCYVGIFRLVLVAHVVLLLLVAAEDADFTDIGLKEAIQHSVAKATRATGDKESLVCKNEDIINC